jgi:hypothetical protein
VDFAAHVVNYLLATAQWLILGRLVMGVFVRNPRNAVWQVFLIATEPPYRVSRLLTAGRVPEGWLWLVSLVWLTVARVVAVKLRNLI